ncbi:hypothetical protein R3X25_11665 [Lutibacter sp. TH_r2]|uniref:hypothetical protein n=1 Tax=Lutibacter sp. TH_r2 TaxID=3082083 RepID=UPI002952F6B3|nr:hypothetical protein [Lutibacter sp. TH_r2]MDV7187940.1 hypothetical protein [Lutibacter sp. TH_r2]
MEEVKEEKFGSRNSLLEPILIKNNIDFIANIWVVTCRQSINNNKDSRYLVIIEGTFSNVYENILKQINPNISVINVSFDEARKSISVFNIKTGKKGVLTYSKFKNRIIELTECKYLDSFALGSKESTPLSRFFRENMGKGFALTDIDFYLTEKRLFLEEKNFIKNDVGYIGIGQCISFKEIISDIFPDIPLLILCTNEADYYIGDFKNVDCRNSEIIKGWGKMVPVKVKKTTKSILINLLKN